MAAARRPGSTRPPLALREDEIDPGVALSPFKAGAWRALSPRERLRRSWQLRSRCETLAPRMIASFFQRLESTRVDYLLISGQATILYAAFSEASICG